MTKKWIAINLLLLLLAGLLGLKLKSSILQYKKSASLDKILPAKKSDKPKVVVFSQSPDEKFVNAEDFSMIPEQNVFVESRSKEEIPSVQIGPPEPPPLAQNPILVGTFISDQEKIASIIDPTVAASSQNKKLRQAQDKRIGDVYQGYTITDITSEHMVLQGGSRMVTIKLHEGVKRAQGGKTTITPTRVIAFGGGGTGVAAGGVGGGAVGGGAPGAPPGGSITVPIGTASSSRGQAPTTSGPVPNILVTSPAGGRGGFTIQMQPGATGSSGATGSRSTTGQPSSTPNRGRNTVPSPFGDLVRPTQ